MSGAGSRDSPASTTGGEAIERVFREEYGRVIASLVRRFGDITIAEDAAGDALFLQPLDIAPDGHLGDVEFARQRGEVDLTVGVYPGGDGRPPGVRAEAGGHDRSVRA